ncbi:hypothetical protein [cyanobacterium endosymbiont of Epithemia clementina EcSB]|uniref:hypothetical protein n=1 Tax=cyanobacterium endosymbiont of Epithemia clementina EcSB TaxID=3034674 RepID=UPI00248048A7|nr:hypothetical protein [cyanobacterium endosymbiont of Epithemia clementina EcSB]WGT67798.1 hypothetical protein P3F56_01520 [cyanobacterium endosymbiont of Epithemia clementina EcSB]
MTILLMETEFEIIYDVSVFSTPNTYVAMAKTKYIAIKTLTIQRTSLYASMTQ